MSAGGAEMRRGWCVLWPGGEERLEVLEVYAVVRCKKHPRYRANRPPTTKAACACHYIYENRRLGSGSRGAGGQP